MPGSRQPPSGSDWMGGVRAVVETVGENSVDGGLAPVFYAALGGPADDLRTARADLTHTLDLLTGSRMHLMIVRIGGLSADIEDGWVERLPAPDATTAIERVADRLAGVAALSRERMSSAA